jgi:hypothetical protein
LYTRGSLGSLARTTAERGVAERPGFDPYGEERCSDPWVAQNP